SPAAEQSFVGAIADTVDASFRATSRLAGDETVVAVVTGLVDVEEGDDVAFLDRRALDVGELASRCFNDADGDVAGDDREWDVEAAVVEVDVGSADLRIERPEQRCPGFEVRSCNVPDFQGLAGASHDGGLVGCHPRGEQSKRRGSTLTVKRGRPLNQESRSSGRYAARG